jgi:hypothetical protein
MFHSTRENTTLRGRVYIDVLYENGDTHRIIQDNVVTNNGRDRIAALISQSSVVFPSYIAIGTGTTAVAVTDTAMETEVDRNAITSTTDASGVVSFQAFFSKTQANGSTISEVGLFDAAAAGTMICHSLLGATIAKDNTISITVTWTITFADS